VRSEHLVDLEDVSAWMPVASGLAHLDISAERGPGGPAMRLDFDFRGGGGFAVARRPLVRAMPESYVLSFAVRGIAPANRLELKLADATGRNVWWRHWNEFAFSAEWQTVRVSSSEIEFAWGPASGGALTQLGAIELAIAAGPGGAGTVWIADLRIEDRTYAGRPRANASSSRPGHAPECALDGDPKTSWRSDHTGDAQVFDVDFGEEREYGGVRIEWDRNAMPGAYRLETSLDGAAWTTAHLAKGPDRNGSWVYLPACRSRFLRLVLQPDTAAGCGIVDLVVQPFEFSRSIHGFFDHIARLQPRGWHPRWLAGEQSYWTPIGLPDGHTCAIMNEEGMVEVDRGTFSIEPFLHLGDRLVTWADADVSQVLEDAWLPIPSSVWRVDGLTLATTAFAQRVRDRATLFIRYRVTSAAGAASAPRRCRLFAAVRPFQVNPPWQAFGELGGMRQVRELAWDGHAVRVDGTYVVLPLGGASSFGAATFEQGEITAHLARGDLPRGIAVSDDFGYASGALAFDLEVAPGDGRDVVLAIPFGAADPADVEALRTTSGADAFDAAASDWRERLGAGEIALPPAVRDYADAMRTAAAHILVNRDGAALQPGPRRYTRSWIRDGAIMAAALLRVGCSAEACEFARWYARYQRSDGNVPCCVDRDGADWLPEHDSHGELVFLVSECFRFTRDLAFLAELWPAVERAVAHLDALRATRFTPEYEMAELRARRGLLPESASHEGYLAHPVHSYWDDFWALRGYGDAAVLAAALGRDAEAERMAASRDELRAAIRASLERTIEERRIDYVPGSVEWADFDPTATANAVALLGCRDDMPRLALARTFDQYLAGFRRRRQGEIDWNNYSPYEVRIVGALVELGRRADAAELADFLLSDRRPRPWNQWPEIAWRDPRSPGHIGDVPHSWIGAEYVLAFRSMLAYEREADRSLVLAAGIPGSWLEGGAEVALGGLPTYYGKLDVRVRRLDGRSLAMSIAGVEVPPGGIVLRPPVERPIARVEVDGRDIATFDGESATVTASPAEVVLRS